MKQADNTRGLITTKQTKPRPEKNEGKTVIKSIDRRENQHPEVSNSTPIAFGTAVLTRRLNKAVPSPMFCPISDGCILRNIEGLSRVYRTPPPPGTSIVEAAILRKPTPITSTEQPCSRARTARVEKYFLAWGVIEKFSLFSNRNEALGGYKHGYSDRDKS